jgi:RimJ/RimL family protein N-acetyltransferase
VRSLTTQRLLLRPFTREDEGIHRLVYADPEVAHPFCGTTRTLEEVRDWLIHRAWQAAEDELGFWAVVRKRDEGAARPGRSPALRAVVDRVGARS